MFKKLRRMLKDDRKICNMREIKFIAWREKDKFMFHVDKINFNTEKVNDFTDCILMQYTGIEDKKGVGVYEGDIVKGQVWIGIVKWINYSWQVHRFDADGEVEEWFIINDYPFEVIGNIYENPELLKNE